MTRVPIHLVHEGVRSIAAYRTPPDPPPIKLDANESPWPLPAAARERLARALSEISLHRYPDLGARELKRAIARRIDARPEELVLGVGSDEVLGILMAALGRPREGNERAAIVTPWPSFVMIPLTARVHGLAPIMVPLARDFGLDRAAMLDAITGERPNIVYLATPNNPTGNAFADDDIDAVVDAAGESLVILDEAYGPFAGRSLAPRFGGRPHVAMLGTLSKIGLAGLRVGWARMHPELAAEVDKARPPYNLDAYAQRAACVLLDELPEVLDDAVARIVTERTRLTAALAQLRGVSLVPSDANFVLIELHEEAGIDAPALHEHLTHRGIAVRRFTSEPRLAAHLRITVGTDAENDALIAALREALPA